MSRKIIQQAQNTAHKATQTIRYTLHTMSSTQKSKAVCVAKNSILKMTAAGSPEALVPTILRGVTSQEMVVLLVAP
jgi:hypothetical protein